MHLVSSKDVRGVIDLSPSAGGPDRPGRVIALGVYVTEPTKL